MIHPCGTLRAIETFFVRIPLRQRVALRGASSYEAQPSVVVRIATEQGLVGWGSIEPHPKAVSSFERPEEMVALIEGTLAPVLLGEDAANIARALWRMDRAVAGHRNAKAAVEMALYDLLGKATGLPVWALLGGKHHEMASVVGFVGHTEIAEIEDHARSLVTAGFQSLKVKVGYGIAADEERVRAVRRAVGDAIGLRVDANEVYDRKTALEVARRLEPYGLEWFEQPIHRADIEGLAEMRRQTKVPIMADQTVITPEDVVRVICAAAADVIKLSVPVNGGIFTASQMMMVAGAAGLPATIGHSFSLTLNTLAEFHVAAAAPHAYWPCEAAGLLKTEEDIVTEPLRLERGMARIPDTPGLGATVDEAKLRYYAATTKV